MKMRPALSAGSALMMAMALVGWTVFHLELTDSFPKADEVLKSSPGEMWLEFSVVPDLARTSFSVRGPAGKVELGAIAVGDSPKTVRAKVTAPLPDGEYTLSWVGAPMRDHTVRGRYSFTVAVGR